ncbi:MAG: CHASE4 domain-containing protein [Candidatus Dojkabacteria bacterium]
MSIRLRSVVLSIFVFLALIIILVILSSFVTLSGFISVEENLLRKDIDRVTSIMKFELEDIDSTALDWASWDETYQFIQDGNKQYLDFYIGPEVLADIEVNLMMFVDLDGDVVYQLAADIEEYTQDPFPEDLAKIVTSRDFLTHENLKEGKTGIVSLVTGDMLLASRPILQTDEIGPAKGSLIVGRYINEVFVEGISMDVAQPVTILRADSPELPDDFVTAKKQLDTNNNFFSASLDGGFMAGYTSLIDDKGGPVLLIRIEEPKLIQEQAIRTVLYNLGVLVITSVAAVLILTKRFDQIFLAKLALLSDWVGKITESGDHSQRFVPHGDDEIDKLGMSINEMLDTIQEAESELEKEESKTEEVEEKLEATAEVEKLNKYLIDRENRMAELKERIEELESNLQTPKDS